MSSSGTTRPKALTFGPVPSRRLGFSLGVDLVPYKVCTLDCVYCQLNRTTLKTLERKAYVPVQTILADLKARLAEGVHPDVITLTGSGEPTLNSGLGELIDGIRAITSVEIAVITNGTLFYREDVRAECAKADIVLPSLDAALTDIYDNVNRPHPELTVQRQIAGLEAFRREFSGRLWLEIFLVDSLNTESRHIDSLKQAIARIRPDKIQLNTAVRPPVETHINSLSLAAMQAIAEQLGPQCEIVADFTRSSQTAAPSARLSERGCAQSSDVRAGGRIEPWHVFDLVARHPCTLADICLALGIQEDHARRLIETLKIRGLIKAKTHGPSTYFQTT